jgi:hypothetical protein
MGGGGKRERDARYICLCVCSRWGGGWMGGEYSICIRTIYLCIFHTHTHMHARVHTHTHRNTHTHIIEGERGRKRADELCMGAWMYGERERDWREKGRK